MLKRWVATTERNTASSKYPRLKSPRHTRESNALGWSRGNREAENIDNQACFLLIYFQSCCAFLGGVGWDVANAAFFGKYWVPGIKSGEKNHGKVPHSMNSPGGYGQIWSYLWQSLRSTMTRFNFEVLMVAANGQHDDQEKHLASSAPRMKRQSHGGMNQEKRIGCVSDSDIQGNKLAQSME